jgi:hypothetical protein
VSLLFLIFVTFAPKYEILYVIFYVHSVGYMRNYGDRGKNKSEDIHAVKRFQPHRIRENILMESCLSVCPLILSACASLATGRLDIVYKY